ncbi:MAG: endonuclease/exonuclease/phosphatase family protein [Candidatus Pacebacteria bacterium]|nr:endonuclease/exonuclease/phosphatase family protein [Candidatus Paceibacterota bacterium]
MKLITLNTWGGRAGKEGLLSFFAKHKGNVDIFCLQEIWADSYQDLGTKLAGGVALDYDKIMVHGVQEISELLTGHSKFFRPHYLDNYGLMTMVNKKLEINEEGEVFVYKHKGYDPEGDAGGHARNIQYITFMMNGRPVTIINFHGLWNGKGKTDTEDRLQQSKNILEFTKKIKGDYILCGDFNLLPDTESLKLFETHGLKNLIKENKITSTRTSFYTKPERHADYIFVTKGIEVKNFAVLPDEVSDHSALLLDFE